MHSLFSSPSNLSPQSSNLSPQSSLSHLYPFEPKRLAIGGHTLSYLDEGQGPVLVMLHGNPTWSFFYRNLVLALRQHYRVIVPDHMGCGLSDKPQEYDYTLANHIGNLERLLDGLGIEKLSLMVHDWGGAIGMGYAVRYPERIEALVVTNTAAFPDTHIPWRIRVCRWPLIGPLLVRGFNGFAWPATFMAVRKKLTPEVAKGFLAPYNSWRNRVAVLRFVQDIPLSPRHRSWPTLAAIEQGLEKLAGKPMLLLWGGRDFCFTTHFLGEWQKRFPKADSHLFAEAGHYLWEDEPAGVLSLLEPFLAQHLGEF